MLGLGSKSQREIIVTLISLVREGERRHAEVLREVSDAVIALSKAVETLAAAQAIPPVPEGIQPLPIRNDADQWLALEITKLQQMGQGMTPELHARLRERANAMKQFNG